MKGSKTKASGRADFLVRMPPELKKRIDEAAREASVTLTDWVLGAIEVRLAARDADAQKRRDIEAIEHREAAKYNEILALLAAKRGLGSLTTLAGKDRTALEGMADDALRKWNAKGAMDYRADATTDLDRLCREYDDLGDEIERIRSKDYGYENTDRIFGDQGYDWEDDEEEEFRGAEGDTSVVESDDDKDEDAEGDVAEKDTAENDVEDTVQDPEETSG